MAFTDDNPGFAGIDKELAGHRVAVEEAFRRWDTDGGRIISPGHLRALTSVILGTSISQEDADTMCSVAGDATQGITHQALLDWVFAPEAPSPTCSAPNRLHMSKHDSELLGVSVAWMESGLLDAICEEFGLNSDPDCYSIAARMFVGPSALGAGKPCPRDGNLNCSYVDALSRCHTGRSTVILSTPPQHSVRMVVRSLSRWCRENDLDPLQTYVWQCSMCNNMFRSVSAADGQFLALNPQALSADLMEKRLCAIGRVLVVLSPWHNPCYLRSAWSLFELYTTLRTDGVCLDVMFPDEELQPFLDAFGAADAHPTWVAFGSVDFGRVLGATSSEGGDVPLPRLAADAVNASISSCLWRWLADGAARKLETCFEIGQEASLQTCVNVAWMLLELREWPLAVHILALGLGVGARGGLEELIGGCVASEADRENPNTRAQGHPSVLQALALHSIGFCLGAQGSHEQAVRFYQTAKATYVAAGATLSSEYVSLLRSLAARLRSRSRLGEAVTLYQEAAAISAMPGIASVIGYGPFIRNVCCDVSREVLADCNMEPGRSHADSMYSRAESNHHSTCTEECDAIRRTDYSEDGFPPFVKEHCSSIPDGSHVVFSSKCSTVVEKSPRPHSGHDDTSTTTTLAYANLLASMAVCLRRQSRHDEATALGLKAKVAYEEAGATQTHEYADLIGSLAARSKAEGDSQQDEGAYQTIQTACEAEHFLQDFDNEDPPCVLRLSAVSAAATEAERFPAPSTAVTTATAVAAAAASAAAAAACASTPVRDANRSPRVDSKVCPSP